MGAKRRGRPPGSAYPERLALRVTGEQRAQMEACASDLGLSLSDWMRAALALASGPTMIAAASMAAIANKLEEPETLAYCTECKSLDEVVLACVNGPYIQLTTGQGEER